MACDRSATSSLARTLGTWSRWGAEPRLSRASGRQGQPTPAAGAAATSTWPVRSARAASTWSMPPPSPSAHTRSPDRLPSSGMSNAVSRPANDSAMIRVVVGRDGHALGEVDAVRHLPGRPVGRHQGDDARLGRGAAEEVEVGAVQVDVAAAVDHDLVPAVPGRRGGVGVGDHRAVGLLGEQALPGDQEPAVGEEVDRPSEPGRPGGHDLAVPVEVHGDDLPGPQWANHSRPSCQHGDST
jgi:hypothetical protein